MNYKNTTIQLVSRTFFSFVFVFLFLFSLGSGASMAEKDYLIIKNETDDKKIRLKGLEILLS